MRDDLQYDLCPGCGEISPKGMGIIAMITHCCPMNIVTYRMDSFKLRHLKVLFGGRGDMDSFKELLYFDTFKAMSNFETASYMDKFIYSLCRDADISAMKRLRAHIELEEDFNAKY